MVNPEIFKSMSYIEQQAKTIKKTAKKLKLGNIPSRADLYQVYAALENIEKELKDNNMLVTYPVSVFDKEIYKINLSHRAMFSLARAGINTLEDLTQKTERDILRIYNIGEKTLKEIKAMLEEKGLSLKKENEKNNNEHT